MLTSVFFPGSPRGAGGAAEAGRAGVGLFGGRRAPPSPCSSEIEFGRARPTSPLHSTVHSLIPCGEREGAAGKEEEGGGREGGQLRGRKEGNGWRRSRDVGYLK